jgi:hypothetical protein
MEQINQYRLEIYVPENKPEHHDGWFPCGFAENASYADAERFLKQGYRVRGVHIQTTYTELSLKGEIKP